MVFPWNKPTNYWVPPFMESLDQRWSKRSHQKLEKLRHKQTEVGTGPLRMCGHLGSRSLKLSLDDPCLYDCVSMYDCDIYLLSKKYYKSWGLLQPRIFCDFTVCMCIVSSLDPWFFWVWFGVILAVIVVWSSQALRKNPKKGPGFLADDFWVYGHGWSYQ
jgi:hypothetical protein